MILCYFGNAVFYLLTRYLTFYNNHYYELLVLSQVLFALFPQNALAGLPLSGWSIGNVDTEAILTFCVLAMPWIGQSSASDLYYSQARPSVSSIWFPAVPSLYVTSITTKLRVSSTFSQVERYQCHVLIQSYMCSYQSYYVTELCSMLGILLDFSLLPPINAAIVVFCDSWWYEFITMEIFSVFFTCLRAWFRWPSASVLASGPSCRFADMVIDLAVATNLINHYRPLACT